MPRAERQLWVRRAGTGKLAGAGQGRYTSAVTPGSKSTAQTGRTRTRTSKGKGYSKHTTVVTLGLRTETKKTKMKEKKRRLTAYSIGHKKQRELPGKGEEDDFQVGPCHISDLSLIHI